MTTQVVDEKTAPGTSLVVVVVEDDIGVDVVSRRTTTTEEKQAPTPTPTTQLPLPTQTDTSFDSSVVVSSSSSSSSLDVSKPRNDETVDVTAVDVVTDVAAAAEEEVISTVPAEKEELAQQEQEILVLQTLARQLEYYFSKQNLANDTYLQTLRHLNDGCVPVTILANFCKVKAILSPNRTSKKLACRLLQEEEMRMHAILQAVNFEYYTDLLQVHSIDTATGKIATDDTPSCAITILAVGPVDEAAFELDLDLAGLPNATAPPNANPNAVASLLTTATEAATTASACDTTNTIILRDVQPGVTEAEVRGLLGEIEECPPVLSVVSDVANCWFITLDSTDRFEMMQALMQLRQMTFPSTGDYVMARLRASAAPTAPVDVYNTLPTTDLLTTKKKKKKNRSKARKKKKSPSVGGNGAGGPIANNSNASQKSIPRPPSLTEDHFPSLQDEKVEWVTTPVEPDDTVEEDVTSEESAKHEEDEEGEEPKSATALSDAASTATTSSSTASSGFDSFSKKQAVGGYAAALLRAPGAKPSVPSVRESPVSSTREEEDEKFAPDPVVITSLPTWGGGLSFADTLRKKDEEREQETQ